MNDKKEYIERGAALLAITGQPSELHCPSWYKGNIMEVPAADVVEVVHGEWKKLRGMAPPEYHGRHICSECGRMAKEWKMHEILTDYCPHCGAKMDGGKHEQYVFV